MPTIHSKTQEVHHSSQHIFNFLTDFNNFKALLPADRIEHWQCTADSCSFTIVGMAALKLNISEKISFSKVSYVSDPTAKYKFNLTVNISDTDPQQCNCTIEMSYDLNPLLNPFAEKPLTGLINMMVTKLADPELKIAL